MASYGYRTGTSCQRNQGKCSESTEDSPTWMASR